MNERIRELIEQAGGIGHDDDGNELTPALVGTSLEKFAELIVRECMRVADSHGKGWVHLNGTAGNRIRQHFGVEE